MTTEQKKSLILKNSYVIFEEEVSIYAKATYLYLCSVCNGNGEAMPRIREISKYCSMSDRTVNRAIKELIEAKLITKENRFDEETRQLSNRYTILNKQQGGLL